MLFWKKYPALRIVLISVFVAAGLVLAIVGWKMPGNLGGLGLMVLGLAFLLAALFIYNQPFTDPKPKKDKKPKPAKQ